MRRSLVLALVAVVFVSCNQRGDTLVHHYEYPSRQGWSIRDTLSFVLPEVDEAANYQLSVGMRFGASFPFAGLWLVAETRLHNPDILVRDTIHFVAMRPGGMPHGSGINLLQSEQPLRTIQLSCGQSGEVHVYHIMRCEVLPSVLGVGVRVERQ